MTDIKRVYAGFGILMLKDGKVLLGKRHDDPVKASSDLSGEGTWTFPGGKMDFGESFEDGIAREVLEETGIRLNSVKVMCVTNDKTEKAHYVTVGMFSDDFEGEAKVMEPDEMTEWRWFSFDKLPTRIFPPCVKMLQNYKEGVFYNKDQNKKSLY